STRRLPLDYLVIFGGTLELPLAAHMPAASRNSSRASWSASQFRRWTFCDMQQPPIWTEDDLRAAAREARAIFRTERLDEPLETWKRTFNQYQERFARLFDEYGIAQPGSLTPAQVAAIFREQLSDALRYLAGPPISEDDLGVLAEADSLAPSRLEADH